jgi:hypothetical protein
MSQYLTVSIQLRIHQGQSPWRNEQAILTIPLHGTHRTKGARLTRSEACFVTTLGTSTERSFFRNVIGFSGRSKLISYSVCRRIQLRFGSLICSKSRTCDGMGCLSNIAMNQIQGTRIFESATGWRYCPMEMDLVGAHRSNPAAGDPPGAGRCGTGQTLLRSLLPHRDPNQTHHYR